MRLKLYRGWWYAVWRDDAGTQRRALRTQDRDAAQRALADFQAAIATPRDTAAGIFAAYEREKGKERARFAWAKLKEPFSHLRPDQITRKACREYADARRLQGVGDGTIQLADGPQTRKGRATVPMTAMARRMLMEAHAGRTSAFVIEYGGKQVAKLRKAFERAAESAGLPWVTPHVLRHSAAVWMAEAGVPMAEIGQFLGHSDERTTYRVYARFSPSYLRKAAGALEV